MEDLKNKFSITYSALSEIVHFNGGGSQVFQLCSSPQCIDLLFQNLNDWR